MNELVSFCLLFTYSRISIVLAPLLNHVLAFNWVWVLFDFCLSCFWSDAGLVLLQIFTPLQCTVLYITPSDASVALILSLSGANGVNVRKTINRGSNTLSFMPPTRPEGSRSSWRFVEMLTGKIIWFTRYHQLHITHDGLFDIWSASFKFQDITWVLLAQLQT